MIYLVGGVNDVELVNLDVLVNCRGNTRGARGGTRGA